MRSFLAWRTSRSLRSISPSSACSCRRDSPASRSSRRSSRAAAAAAWPLPAAAALNCSIRWRRLRTPRGGVAGRGWARGDLAALDPAADLHLLPCAEQRDLADPLQIESEGVLAGAWKRRQGPRRDGLWPLLLDQRRILDRLILDERRRRNGRCVEDDLTIGLSECHRVTNTPAPCLLDVSVTESVSGFCYVQEAGQDVTGFSNPS